MSKERRHREFSKQTKRDIRNEQDGRCAICGSKAHLQIHHIKPISHGGGKDKENAVGVCAYCHKKLDNEALHNHHYLTDMSEGEIYNL